MATKTKAGKAARPMSMAALQRKVEACWQEILEMRRAKRRAIRRWDAAEARCAKRDAKEAALVAKKAPEAEALRH